VRQRGCILKPSGKRTTFSVKYRTADGKQVFKSGFSTKELAQRELNRVLSEIDSGEYVERKPITVAKFAEQWLAGRRRIRGSTESGYASMIAKQIVPRIGLRRLVDLRLSHFQGMVSGMLEDGLSAKTIHNVVTLLRSMLAGPKGSASAVRLGYLKQDPTAGLELPRLESNEIIPPTPEQVWGLIDAAQEIGGVGYGLTFIGALTGMRRNEVLAVRFSDVDWFNSELRVKTAVSKRRATDGAHKWEWVLGQPKSKKSIRRIHLAESVLKMLTGLKALTVGSDDFVFRSETGGFIDPDKFDADIWAPITKQAGMSGTRFHDLRHFFASQLIANGETAAYVRDQLGHSSIQVTFDTYGHLFPGSGRDASRRLEDSMRKAREKNQAGSNLVANHAEGKTESGRKQPLN
jgi:integrase